MSNRVVHEAQHTDFHAHPSQRTYIQIAIFLAIVTGIEVAIYYVEAISDFLVPILLVLSALKFILVVGYFMHLKFDTKMLMWIFTAAMILSVAVYIATWLMMENEPVRQFIGDMSI